MGDNRGQTIFLSVIGIATLLVTIVGATFAYFTTQVDTENTSGGSTSGTTATIGNTTVKFEDETNAKLSKLEYPGGIAMVGAKASIAKDPGADTNDYEATFDLTITYQNPTKTDLTWKLYKVSNSSPVTLEEKNAIECELNHKEDAGTTMLWYAGKDSETETDTCKLTGALTTKLGTQVATGTFTKETEADTPVSEESLKGITLSTTANPDDYYYLVVEYPNTTENDAADQGKVIKFTLGVDSDSIHVDVAQTD